MDATNVATIERTGAELTCMKCGGEMRTRNRNGITIEQCASCHGIYLDRGELERLISAESSPLGGLLD